MIILRYKQFSKHKDIELKSWKPNLKHPDLKFKKEEDDETLDETRNKYPEAEFEPQEEDEWIDEEVNEYPEDDENYE